MIQMYYRKRQASALTLVWQEEKEVSRPLNYYVSIVTSPAVPSTVTIEPSLMNVVPLPVPTTAGIPNSLATTAPCEIAPPELVTIAPTIPKKGVQGGVRARATRMSPFSREEASSRDRTTLALPR